MVVRASGDVAERAPAAAAARGGISSRSTQIRAAAAADAKQELLSLASTQLGVPVGEPDGRARASSRAAARPSPTAQLHRRQAASTSTLPGLARPAPARPGQGIAKPVSQYKLVGTRAAADRHPGEGQRARTRTSRTSASRGCCTRRVVRPRGAGREHVAEPLPAERRRELDRAHPGRAGRAGRATSSPSSRRRSTTRSRRRRS